MIESSIEHYFLKTESPSTRRAFGSQWASVFQDIMIITICFWISVGISLSEYIDRYNWMEEAV